MARRCFVVVMVVLASQPAAADPPIDRFPSFGDSFWKHWGDGQAEISSYDLTFPRYGATRKGVAVTIFVTETFAHSLRVKSDPGARSATDEYPVMKLNIVKDFPTGVYDYNLMTSTFVALSTHGSVQSGEPTKISFSSQEWCGHVYHQLRFNGDSIAATSHSYFDGEADQQRRMPLPKDGIAQDTLWHWARGLAAPALKPGESLTVPFLPSLEHARLSHQPLQWTKATLSRRQQRQEMTVPAGTFDTEIFEVVSGQLRLTFWVELDHPRRIIKWKSGAGESAVLIKSDRLKYWELNDPRGIDTLKRIGLLPRPPRSP